MTISEVESTLSTTISSIEADLIRDEGWRERAYKDSLGYLTIGVGHNLQASGLCPEAIVAQLRYDIRVAEQRLDGLLSDWREHPEPVQRVLVNLSFNLGDKLRQFKGGTLALIDAGQYDDAAVSLLANKRYHAQVGTRLDRLADLLRSVV